MDLNRKRQDLSQLGEWVVTGEGRRRGGTKGGDWRKTYSAIKTILKKDTGKKSFAFV